jgi:endonuclease YncB( thermonuclease family)
MDSGDHENGLLAQMRHRSTDFGSPYQGPVGSSMVFHDQQLLEEREKWLRAQYGVRHFDPEVGLFGINSVFNRARHLGYRYLPGGESVKDGYAGLRGRNLMSVNLGQGNWRISVQDADTVVVKKAGIRGRIADLFGMNAGYSFRLAGIDAPETEHGGRRGGAQPHAEQSIQGLKAMLAQAGSLQLVFDPMQTTYGRGLGVLVSDKGNINYELVRRGLTGHLPFGKSDEAMIDYRALKSMETRAATAHRGMWAQPFWQAMYDVSAASGSRPTFNTLTQSDKIVQNISTMDTVALMEQAQAQGMYSTAMALEASRIGKFSHQGVDNVRPAVTGSSTAFYNSYLHEALVDTSQWMKTHGSGNKPNPVSRRNNYGKLDKALVIDSMGNTTSSWSRRRYNAMNQYGPDLDRKYKMMLEQQQINNTLFDSQINHHRMQ